MDTKSLLELVKEHLRQPEYLHVLLNPLPVYGLGLGVLALLISLAMRSRHAQIIALIIVFISAGSAWPVTIFGVQSYDRVEAMSTDAGNTWLDAHAQRAIKCVFIFNILAGVSLIALVLPLKFPRAGTLLASATVLLSFVALAAGIWIAYAGGQIRHKEFRYGTPPEAPGGYEKMRN